MKLGVLCHSSLGGSSRVAIELAHEVAHRGHTVDLFARTPPTLLGPPPPGLTLHCLSERTHHAPGQLHVDWSERELAAFVAMVHARLQLHPVDILHLHYAVPFAEVALRLKRALGPNAPFVVGTLHGTDVLRCADSPDHARALSHALRQGVDALTTVSHALADASARWLPGTPRPTVIPNFVDLRRYHTGSGPRPPSPRVVAHVSNFRAVKRPWDVARAFGLVAARLPAELHLIGTGPLLDDTVQALTSAGLREHVRVLGLRHDVAQQLRHADALLLTSEFESFSMTALEALASGTPVVAPRVGGLPEVVQHGQSGLLYRPGEVAHAAQCLERLLRSPERFRARAAASVAGFDARRVVPRYLNLYERCARSESLVS